MFKFEDFLAIIPSETYVYITQVTESDALSVFEGYIEEAPKQLAETMVISASAEAKCDTEMGAALVLVVQ